MENVYYTRMGVWKFETWLEINLLNLNVLKYHDVRCCSRTGVDKMNSKEMSEVETIVNFQMRIFRFIKPKKKLWSLSLNKNPRIYKFLSKDFLLCSRKENKKFIIIVNVKYVDFFCYPNIYFLFTWKI